MRFIRGVFVLSLAGFLGCTSQKKEPIVPEETRERSKERYGEQQQSMDTLHQTPAEQAAAAHDSATRPVKDPGRED